MPFVTDAIGRSTRAPDRGRTRTSSRSGPVNIDVFTLFPAGSTGFRPAPRAQRAGARPALELVDLRATTPLKAGQVDDTPYGGGAGMVIRVDVVEAALRALRRRPDRGRGGGRVIALAAGGRQFDEELPSELAGEPPRPCCAGATRASTSGCTSTWPPTSSRSAPTSWRGRARGDGGLRRGAPQAAGALGHEESAVEESFSAALAGAPSIRTTRARSTGAGTEVPDVLLSGDHARCGSGGWSRAAAAGEPAIARSSGAGSFATMSAAAGVALCPRGLALFLFHERCHRQHRARPAAPSPVLPGG